MAKERTSSAFKSLLQGINFARNIQKDQEEEQRYQDQINFRDQEFNWRKLQAKIAANQWARNFKRKAKEFDESQQFLRDKLAINDENADADRKIQKKSVDARIAYTNALKDSMQAQVENRDKLSALKEKLATYDNKFRDIIRQSTYTGLPKTDAEALKAYYNSDEAPDKLFSPFQLAFGIGLENSNVKEAREYANKLDRIERTKWVEDKLTNAEKVLNEALRDVDGNTILSTPSAKATIRILKSEVQKLTEQAKNGLIKDRDTLKRISRMNARLLAYDFPQPVDNSAYTQEYQKALGKGQAGLAVESQRQKYIDQGLIEE